MRNKILTIMAVMFVLVSLPISMAFEIRGTVIDNKTGLQTWNAQNFAGFYYDIDKNISSETMTVFLSGTEGRTIKENDLKYVSEKVNAEYKIHKQLDIKVNKEINYQVLGWKGERWVAVGGNANKLARLGIEMDTSDKKTLVPGDVWALGSGYEIAIKSVDVKADPRQAWITLSKDGKVLDDAVVQYKTLYEYTTKVLGNEDVVVFAVYIDSIFSGTTSDMIQFKYAWMIYPDGVKEIKSSDTYGSLEVVNAGSDKIELTNKNVITLSKDSEIDIMDAMKFKVADSDTLRFYPKIDTTTTVVDITPLSTPAQVVTTTATPVQTTAVPPAPATTPVQTSTQVSTPAPVVTQVSTPVQTTLAPSTPITDKKGLPGFNGILAIAGIIGVCLLMKRR